MDAMVMDLMQSPHSTNAKAKTAFYIQATDPVTRPRHSLKNNDTFFVLDSYGDVGASPGGPDGLFHCDTRFLSHFELVLNGTQFLLLGSRVNEGNSAFTADLTNADI